MIRNFFQFRQKRKAIKNIRECMEWLGHPIDNFSDEEVESGLTLFTKTITNTGFAIEDLYRASKTLNLLETPK